jgi:hypothetical protein
VTLVIDYIQRSPSGQQFNVAIDVRLTSSCQPSNVTGLPGERLFRLIIDA